MARAASAASAWSDGAQMNAVHDIVESALSSFYCPRSAANRKVVRPRPAAASITQVKPRRCRSGVVRNGAKMQRGAAADGKNSCV
jgi:hypothetical protein